jgi:hypothetical protein
MKARAATKRLKEGVQKPGNFNMEPKAEACGLCARISGVRD